MGTYKQARPPWTQVAREVEGGEKAITVEPETAPAVR